MWGRILERIHTRFEVLRHETRVAAVATISSNEVGIQTSMETLAQHIRQ